MPGMLAIAMPMEYSVADGLRGLAAPGATSREVVLFAACKCRIYAGISRWASAPNLPL